MSLLHTVVFRLRHEDASPEADAFLTDARRVLTGVPGVTEFVIRRQVSPKSTLTHQFSMRFADEAAYRAYDEHPDHRGFVAERWIPEVAEFQEYDFVE